RCGRTQVKMFRRWSSKATGRRRSRASGTSAGAHRRREMGGDLFPHVGFKPLSPPTEVSMSGERICLALESIADALTKWVTLEQERFNRAYPVKPDATDATVTIPVTEEQRLEALLHSASPEEIAEYIGPREQEFLDRPEPSPEKSP